MTIFPTPSPHGPHGPTASARGLYLHQIVAMCRRQAVWILGTAVMVFGLVAFATYRQAPVYLARATLRLEEKPTSAPDVFSQLSYPTAVETEIEILRSRSVAVAAARALGLIARVTSPEGVTMADVAGSVTVDTLMDPGAFTLIRGTEGVEIQAASGQTAAGPYARLLALGGLSFVPVGPDAGPDTVTITIRDAQAVAEGLRGRLRVTRPQNNARILIVTWESTDPVQARNVVNAIAQAYIARRNTMQQEQARTAVRFLQTQVAAVSGQLSVAEESLQAFRRAHLLLDPSAQAEDQVRRLATQRAEREALEVRRTALRSVLARTTSSADTSGAWSALAATPTLMENPTIAGLLQQLTTLESEGARAAAWRIDVEPDPRAVTQIRAALSARLGVVAQEQLDALDQQAQRQDSVLGATQSELAGIPATELQYARLERQVELLGGVFAMLQTRLKEAEISEAVEMANIQLVDPALVPSRPVRPRPDVNLTLGAVVGLFLGLVAGLAREWGDTAVRLRDEVSELTDLPVLAVIPRQQMAFGRRRDPVARIEGRLVTRLSPSSPAAEAYRALRTSIAFSALPQRRAMRTLVITSAEPQDGKSTTAVNLAVALAEQGLRVLLAEADQRRPVLHRVLRVERTPGLSDVLSGRAAVADALRPVLLPEHATGLLDFLPGGRAVPNPAELAGSVAMRTLLADLSSRYDAVVLDTPPLSMVTDGAVTGTLVDGVIVVARMGKTNRDSLRRAVDELRAVGAPVVGLVLTDVHHGEDRYGQRYGQYYAEYGEGGDASVS